SLTIHPSTASTGKIQMLDYLFRSPVIFQVREARARFVDNDEILIGETNYMALEDGDIWRRRRSRGVARQMHAWFFYYSLRPFHEDRKSTRLNSSHVSSSYAVFCLKKKTKELSQLYEAHGGG